MTLAEFAFGAGAIATAPVWLPALGASAATALVAYSCYELAMYTDSLLTEAIEDRAEDSKKPELKTWKKDPVRTKPNNLDEQLALEEAHSNPGVEIPTKKLPIKDLNYPPADWAKKQHIHEGLGGNDINIHYWENRHTGERSGFKFKNP